MMQNKHARLHRWLRRFAWIALALFITLILAREYVDWSGKRRWAEVKQMLAQDGESLDFRKIAPDPVPDGQNFCAIPALKDLAAIPEDVDPKSPQGLERARLLAAALPDGTKGVLNGLKGGSLADQVSRGIELLNAKGYVPPPPTSRGAAFDLPIDLSAWAAWLRKDGSLPMPPSSGNPARDILAALSKDTPLVADLARGLDRPESQWTPAWKTRDLPETYFAIRYPEQAPIMKLVSMLCFRAAVAANAGDAVAAHQSLLIAVRLTQANTREPFLIGALISCGDAALLSNAVWELCDAHSGSASDYRTLQEALEKLDLRQTLLDATRGEIAFAANTSTYMKRTRDIRILNPFDAPTPAQARLEFLALHLVPDGWIDENTATIAQWYLDYYIKPLRDSGFQQLLARQKEIQNRVSNDTGEEYRHLDETMALITMRGASGVVYGAIYAQCLVNEAEAACALERYRIELGVYPDSLDAANQPGEKPIPLDVISGKPMGYRKTADGRYALWCVGFDGRNDGGKRIFNPTNPRLTRFGDPNYRGDWVWDFPNSTATSQR